MKCPKCSYTPLQFDDSYHEEMIDNCTKRLELWFVFCPNCNTDYKVKEIYTLTSQEIIDS